MMTRLTRPATLAALLGTLGCGEVYADLDVRKAAEVEPVFEPGAVYAGSVTWLAVRARFDGDIALIDDHGLDGSKNIKLAYDRLDFFPGECPTTAVSEAAAQATSTASARTADGSWVFCAAVEIGPFETTTVVPLQIAFWNGTERLTGSVELTVNAVAATDLASTSGAATSGADAGSTSAADAAGAP
jgi:hypothetical protein